MCPNCHRGLTDKNELCAMCAGTGFYNPQSLPINETPMDEVPEVAAPEVVAPTVEEIPAVAEVAAEPIAETSAEVSE